ncbi:MAG: hypothetical protein Q8Q25_01680 [bacterium]|nr:hypothetical protein [bacterium]
MNENGAIKAFFIFIFLFSIGLIKAYCCMPPSRHCPNWHVIYTNDLTQAIETDAGKVLTIERGQNNSLICPTCKHPLLEHTCDANGLPLGPRYKEKK